MVLKCDASIRHWMDRAELVKALTNLGVEAKESGTTVYCIVTGNDRSKDAEIVNCFLRYPQYNITRHE